MGKKLLDWKIRKYAFIVLILIEQEFSLSRFEGASLPIYEGVSQHLSDVILKTTMPITIL